MGKTALLRAAGAAAAESGFLVLGARGGELERSFPFGVVGQLFAPIVHGTREQGDEEDLLAGDARLAEVALSPVAGSPPRDADFALLNALYWLCANLCERSPVLLVVDDAHWADSASLRFLSFLARRGDGLALALAVAARTGEPGVGADPFAELGREDRARRIEPGPLSVAAVSGLVRERLWEGASDDLCRACHDATRGNALLVEQVIVGLRQSGKPLMEIAAGDIDGVAAAGRLGGRHGPDRPAGTGPARALAEATAVLGARAEPRHAAALAKLEPDRAEHLADGLRSAGLLAPGARARVRPSSDQDLDLRRDPGRRARLGARRGRPSCSPPRTRTPGRSPRICSTRRGTAIATRSPGCRRRPRRRWRKGRPTGPSPTCDVRWRSRPHRSCAPWSCSRSAPPRPRPTIRPPRHARPGAAARHRPDAASAASRSTWAGS